MQVSHKTAKRIVVDASKKQLKKQKPPKFLPLPQSSTDSITTSSVNKNQQPKTAVGLPASTILRRGRKKKIKVVDLESKNINSYLEYFLNLKIPVETECEHNYIACQRQTRSADEIESIMYVCTLCG